LSFVIYVGSKIQIPNSFNAFQIADLAIVSNAQQMSYTMISWTPPIAQWWCEDCLHRLCSYDLVGIPLVPSL